MKKKVLSALLATAMVATMFAGCGSKADDAATTTDDAAATTDDAAAGDDAAAEEEGKVLNIYCWNEEFKSRLTAHYPGYEEVDATSGKIGDVDVKWNI
ncbi:MAG: carbohydrate ABC transporter substrate-binding protein, partial [Lachnospiraceae bacterium]|nr:carbohydrate ABC transporter substrate-binding protein [Lachnospiraceae bacterium]